MALVRLHKFIAQHGVASRRAAERWIQYGRVEVNGQVERTLGRQIDPLRDKVKVDGKLLANEAPAGVYWMLHKPDATMTTRRDPEGRITVFDLPEVDRVTVTLKTVGRLDYRTEGLLLLSNDGEFVQKLTHPKYHVSRTYDVLLPRKLTLEELQRFGRGFMLSDGSTGKLVIEHQGSKNMGAIRGFWYRLTVHEGRNRLVRRIFEKLGVNVVRLLRVAFGPLWLPEDLAPGQMRVVPPEMVQALLHPPAGGKQAPGRGKQDDQSARGLSERHALSDQKKGKERGEGRFQKINHAGNRGRDNALGAHLDRKTQQRRPQRKLQKPGPSKRR